MRSLIYEIYNGNAKVTEVKTWKEALEYKNLDYTIKEKLIPYNPPKFAAVVEKLN